MNKINLIPNVLYGAIFCDVMYILLFTSCEEYKYPIIIYILWLLIPVFHFVSAYSSFKYNKYLNLFVKFGTISLALYFLLH